MKSISLTLRLRPGCLIVCAGALGYWLGPVIARAATGGAPSPSLSFAGTLKQNGTPLSGSQTLKFVFKKNGTATCSSPDLMVIPDSSGQFTVAIPLAGCPTSLFDGSEVKLDVSVGGNLAISDQPITSVPSAKYAENVGFP